MLRVNIVGAGLAGLSAAVTLAKQNTGCRLISVQISERAQSVLAEGGINAAMDVSGEGDTPREHYEDTMRGGVYLADPDAVRRMTETAPEIVGDLIRIGVPFNMEGDALVQRRFGGQKKTRTTYARSSTGKALMTAMIDAARKYENIPGEPLIERCPHHRFMNLVLESGRCAGVRVQDLHTGQVQELRGPVILAFGGPNGLFPGRTTGTTANDGCALAAVFAQGVELANLEFIQYHPTTVRIAGKRMLVSEAARGEGGRLYAVRDGKPWFFMEEKYPELGNLMPRDVVSREMDAVRRDPACQPQVWLDLTGLPGSVWDKRLPDLRREILHYLAIDPAGEPVPVSPGIHFFMGGICVDKGHRTNIPGLYAAGECACQYHGANRLGGNSLLGAIYGGRVAAHTAAAERMDQEGPAEKRADETGDFCGKADDFSAQTAERLAQILTGGLGIVRDEESIGRALEELDVLRQEIKVAEVRENRDRSADLDRIRLGEAMLLSARARRESRGAHVRADYPDRNDEDYQRTTIAVCEQGEIRVFLRKIPGLD